MQNKKYLRLAVIAVVVIALLWWLLSLRNAQQAQSDQAGEDGSSVQGLVSAIQPIDTGSSTEVVESNSELSSGSNSLNQQPNKLPEIQTQILKFTPLAADQTDFENAIRAIQSQDYATAEQFLDKLIARQPGLLEPYINLASAQAAAGDLENARSTLMQGLTANENYGLLFTNLQKVHAALAADAYQVALAEDQNGQTQSSKRLALPLAAQLNANVDPNDQSRLSGLIGQVELLGKELEARNTSLIQLTTQLEQAKAESEKMSLASTSALDKAQTLEQQLASIQQDLTTKEQTLTSEITALKQVISQKDEASNNNQLTVEQQQTELTNKLATAEQTNAELAQQLAQANSRVELAQAELEQLRTQNQVLIASAAVTNTTNTSDVVAAAEPTTPIALASNAVASDGEHQTQVIERVRSWASAWSAQDVASYISHYAEGYRPSGSSLSHNGWREQRRVRLTNKSFINVTLSNFSVSNDNGIMEVIFTQRYQADRFDETIRKRLRLSSLGDDWAQARIVDEKVIR